MAPTKLLIHKGSMSVWLTRSIDPSSHPDWRLLMSALNAASFLSSSIGAYLTHVLEVTDSAQALAVHGCRYNKLFAEASIIAKSIVPHSECKAISKCTSM